MNKFLAIIKTFFPRKRQYALNMLVSIFFVLLFIVLINYIASIHEYRIDLTESGSFTLSPQTIKILKNIKNDLKFIGFFNPDEKNRKRFMELTDIYKFYSNYISSEIVDPYKSPLKTKAFDVKKSGVVVIQYGAKTRKATAISESGITTAIKKLTTDALKTICFTEGHGECSISNSGATGCSIAGNALENDFYRTKQLLLLKIDRIPEECSVLVEKKKKKPFLKHETDIISKYLQKGGPALFLIEPGKSINLVSFARDYGIAVRNDIIVDKRSRLRGGDYTVPLVTEYEKHAITAGFNLPTFYPIARSVGPLKKELYEKAGLKVTPLLRASRDSWGETEITGKKLTMNFNSIVDTPGPVSIAAAAEGKGNKKFSFVVFGDASFANNSYFPLFGNGDLFLNTINWLTGEEDLIAIRPKDYRITPLILSRAQGITLWCVYIGALLLIITAGTIMFFHRKRL